MRTYKPRLMLFSHVSNTASITGAEKLLLLFCLQLTPYLECILVAPYEGKLTAYARKQGITVRIQPYPLLFGMYQPGERLEQEAEELRNQPGFASVVHCIQETAPDFVLTNTIVNVLPAMAAKTLGIPVLWKITEIMTATGYTASVMSVVEKYSDCLIAISEASARIFREAVSKPIFLIPPSADNKLLRPAQMLIRNAYRKVLHLKNSHSCIGYISSFIQPEKGLLEFIGMARILAESHPDCQFVVIGNPADQAYHDRCISEVNASGYGTRFRFVPFVESVHTAYSAMDILVVPSIVQEGFGMTALEGMLCGKPVVSFDSGGLGELMRNTGNGHFVVPVGDYAALAAKVSELLNTPSLLKNTGNRNAITAKAVYGMDVYRQKIQAFILELQQSYPVWMSGAISRSLNASKESMTTPLPSPKRLHARPKRKTRRKRRHGKSAWSQVSASSPGSRRKKRKAGAGRRFKRRSKSTRRK
ncbi:glycosyltransferase family 4 protein [Paenibacillus donghaensis]|uniref:glycosyltransferase family 4 protein n=1 Tax=Paenibacillus donghaensis TaxID=414771 RepID=UPI0018841A2A|nr:glycosyltransferase family 4 protein [Paenibacillus donghaensis]MBE9916007.1 glycosyltransferase family 4 protein [Paenibacillus donghaensis]